MYHIAQNQKLIHWKGLNINSVNERINNYREKQLSEIKRINTNGLPKLALRYKPKNVQVVRQVKRWSYIGCRQSAVILTRNVCISKQDLQVRTTFS